ncbi:MAG: hypothetical protein PHD13_00915 [Methanocellales archaeon]|nr:hypothetical protein [Methanocellales archaeon]MDD3291386.1 hypothetical protein [Methanocellales archaeon]MDD5234724.1 hypothetical protein [Methanocellales archaeon]MDD5484925.1 hypothetical protein [Methanocellales archaeon]
MMVLLSLGILYLILPGPEDIADRATLFSRESTLGTEVYTEGIVFDKRVTDGDHLILWIGPERTKVFISHDVGAAEVAKMIEKGDLVRIYGIVAEYEGEIEIDVKSKAHIIPKVL